MTSVNELKEWEEYEESWKTKTKSILLKDAQVKEYAKNAMTYSQLPF